MKIIVETEEEAVNVCRVLVKICNDIRLSNIDPILQTSHEQFLCSIRDSVEVNVNSGTKNE
jgi:hypothetical protein